MLMFQGYYTPYNVLSYKNEGLCMADEDFGSGGVLLPTNYTYTSTSGTCSSVVINADKQSNLYPNWVGSVGSVGASRYVACRVGGQVEASGIRIRIPASPERLAQLKRMRALIPSSV
jgi:hypothetical protein